MLNDLLMHYLPLGMSLEEVTNLLGHPEVRDGVHVRGEYLEQTVYVYRSGMHNGWLVRETPLTSASTLQRPGLRDAPLARETNSLILYFGRNDAYLKEWSPALPVVQPVSASESDASREASSDMGLHIGDLRFAATPSQFQALLGPPSESRKEWQFDYFLGKRAKYARDHVFLELHFDQSQKLTRVVCSEH